jgi:hypothetical protein
MAKKQVQNIPDPETPEFHELFPVHLKYTDGKETRNCYFKDEIDLRKYISRYKLKSRGYSVTRTEPKNKM